jgi:hypothetical protein
MSGKTMYGTLEDTLEGEQQPMLAGQQSRRRRSQKQAVFSSQGQLPERGLARFASARPVLREILEKPRRQEGEQRNLDLGNVANSHQTPKSFVYTLLNPRSTAWQAVAFKRFITIVIVSDLVCFVISTEPDITEEQMKLFYKWEGITSTIFLIEYLACLLSETESKKYSALGPIRGQLQYATTYSALLDLFATLPFFLELISGWDLPTLTYLHSFRLLRILRTNGFAEATNVVYRVIYYN